MPDIRLIQSPEAFPRYSIPIDWLLRSDGTLDDTQALATAIIVALGTDRLASPDDILPDPDSTDRAGWWGDMDAEELFGGWPIGTKLWLLKRAKIVGPEDPEGATVTRVEQYIIEAISAVCRNEDCNKFRCGGIPQRLKPDRRLRRNLPWTQNTRRTTLPSPLGRD